MVGPRIGTRIGTRIGRPNGPGGLGPNAEERRVARAGLQSQQIEGRKNRPTPRPR